MINVEKYQELAGNLSAKNIELVAVSKTKPVEDIMALYDAGQRQFAENYVQEITAKQPVLPADIHWHFIGHLQTNKVKFITPFVHLIQSIDSIKLLKETDKQAKKFNRVINCLLQIHVAKEESKFGMNEEELAKALNYADTLTNIKICGLMGMASFTDDEQIVAAEFIYLKDLFDKYQRANASIDMKILSMGMSSDYKLAAEHGSTMVRIGSLLFGARS